MDLITVRLNAFWGVFFALFRKLPIQIYFRKRFSSTFCVSSRFCCFGLDFCASGLLWAEILANGSPSIELRFA